MKKHRFLRALAAGALLSTAAVAWPASAVSAPGAVPSLVARLADSPSLRAQPIHAATDPIGAATEARRAFGLGESRTVAADLLADPTAVTRGAAFGVPVTAAELPGLARRFDVMNGSDSVLRKARDLAPDTFAGAWFDIARGRLVLAYTDDRPTRIDDLRTGAHRPDAIDVIRMPFTKRALDDTALRMYQDRGLARAAGVDLQATGVHEDAGVVVVEVGTPSSTSAEQLASIYGVDPGMLIVRQATAGANDATIRGGEFIGNSSELCSSGAYGRIRVSNNPQVFKYVQVTAGHCIGDGYYATTDGTPSGSFTGAPYILETEAQGPYADAQRMYNGTTDTTRYVRAWSQGDLYLTEASSPAGTFDVPGAVVCQHGWKTHGVADCGTIQSTNYSYTDPTGHAYISMRQVNYARDAGDSGATVTGFIYGTSNVPLAGIHKGVGGGYAVYTQQDWARAAVGIEGWECQY